MINGDPGNTAGVLGISTMPRIWIQLNSNRIIDGRHAPAGSTVEVDERLAHSLIARQFAIRTSAPEEQPKQKPKSTK
jgi:hypothetical protein